MYQCPRFQRPSFCLSCISSRTWQRTQPCIPHSAAGETLWTFTKTQSTCCAKSVSCGEAWRNLNGRNWSTSYKRLIRTAIYPRFFWREVENNQLLTIHFTPVSICTWNYSTFQCTKVCVIEQFGGSRAGEGNGISEKHSLCRASVLYPVTTETLLPLSPKKIRS